MLAKKFSSFKTMIFDCDGVILNSNKLKTNAFKNVAMPFGQAAADALEDYHIANGGLSRYEKFNYFLEKILPTYCESSALGPKNVIRIEDLLHTFAAHIHMGLKTCEIAPGLDDLRNLSSDTDWMMVSGSDQRELRQVLRNRGIANYFQAGIFGSPENKDTILRRELQSGKIVHPAIYIGDSVYDFESAQRAEIDFIFVSGWSEVKDWQTFVLANQIKSVESILDLASLLTRSDLI
jgi:phosphoglycolate phosphatase-like HAD superfamily hydrolase